MKALIRITIIFLLLSCSQQISKESMRTYAEARSAYLNGDFDTASQLLEVLLPEKSLTTQVMFLLAKTYFMQGKNMKTEELLEKIVKQTPEHADARLWLARTKIALDEPLEARAILEWELLWSGEDPRILALMGACQQILGETDKAMDYYRRAALFEDELVKIYLSLAAIYGRSRIKKMEEYYVYKAESIASADSLFAGAVQAARTAIDKK